MTRNSGALFQLQHGARMPDDRSETTDSDRAPALRRMLEAVVERRKAPLRTRSLIAGRTAELKVMTVAEIMAIPLLPCWRARMERAGEDGVMESLYASIREEGWRAYALGGIKAMHDLADRACGYSARLSGILDHRWDGIGIPGRGVWVA